MESKSDLKRFLGAINDNEQAITELKNIANTLIQKLEKIDKKENPIEAQKLDNKIRSLVSSIKILQTRNETNESDLEDKATERLQIRLSKTDLEVYTHTVDILQRLLKSKISRREYIQISSTALIKFVSEFSSSNTQESFESFLNNYSFKNEKENEKETEEKELLKELNKRIGYLDKNVMKATYAVFNNMYFSKHVADWFDLYPIMNDMKPYYDRNSKLYNLNKNIDSQLDKHYRYFQEKKKFRPIEGDK
ncbi:hypothetical protein [Liquorilactobacillus hordei]|uniref:hypothetical protein n=1 Tax=Liquorilactobacillus hordei TaxID=468911 RepID=UPI001CBD58D2|nr:hypothetical protein [Liquorilactobacillus hordei]MBZ2406666.1 hypothetical protein [Liquorilactobacillus hordei]